MLQISVIIPIYNRKFFREKCIDSLLMQTFQNFELLLINDGSTDGSGELCNDFSRQDSRIRVFHVEKNRGACHARQIGVEHALGEWISFIDSDDTIPVNALQRLFEATGPNDVDIIMGFSRKKRFYKRRLISPVHYRKLLIAGRYNVSVPWGKLFRKYLFDKYTFAISREIIMGEDMIMNIRLAFASSKKVCLVGGSSVYNYILNETSICCNFRLTPEYINLVHQERLSSIPVNERSLYMDTMIYRRLRTLRRMLRWIKTDGERKELRNSAYVMDLIRDIRSTNYWPIYYPYRSVWTFLKQ